MAAANPNTIVVLETGNPVAMPWGDTSFSYSHFKVSGGDPVTASFTVTNTGDRTGADVPQLYLTGRGNTQMLRLLGFERVSLAPGASRKVRIAVDPRLPASFDAATGHWRMTSDGYEMTLARAAGMSADSVLVRLEGRLFGN